VVYTPADEETRQRLPLTRRHGISPRARAPLADPRR
jgi:hypothetical protein